MFQIDSLDYRSPSQDKVTPEMEKDICERLLSSIEKYDKGGQVVFTVMCKLVPRYRLSCKLF